MFFIIAKIDNSLYRVLCVSGNDTFMCDMTEQDICEKIPTNLCGNFKKSQTSRKISYIYAPPRSKNKSKRGSAASAVTVMSDFPSLDSKLYMILCKLITGRYLCANPQGAVSVLSRDEVLLNKSNFYNVQNNGVNIYALNKIEFTTIAMPTPFYRVTAKYIAPTPPAQQQATAVTANAANTVAADMTTQIYKPAPKPKLSPSHNKMMSPSTTNDMQAFQEKRRRKVEEFMKIRSGT